MARPRKPEVGNGSLHLGDLTPDPKNARRHTPRNVGLIESALREVGAARSIVVDEDNVILAGNATVEGAAAAGIERVRVVEADGHELIAVRRRGLTPQQKVRLALYDNQAAALAEWELPTLQEFLGVNLLDGIFQAHELNDLGLVVPEFTPVSIDEQGRLDEKAKVTCPSCGHEFTP